MQQRTTPSRIRTASGQDKGNGVPRAHAVRMLVLGAGRPEKGNQHPALRAATNRSRVFDWMRHAVAGLNAKLQFVGGYQLEQIIKRYPDLEYFVNPDWESTGAVSSMLGVGLEEGYVYYVSYADILFRDSLVRRMEATQADVVVAADSRWKSRFEGRTPQDLARCEKLNVFNGEATRLGPDIDPAAADAEFVGIARFSPKAIALVLSLGPELAARLRKARISELVEFLRQRGLKVGAVDVCGDWAELNEAGDLARFVLGTKAQTLQRLQGLVTRCRIEDQVSFTVGEWKEDNAAVRERIAEKLGPVSLVVRSSALTEDGFVSANAGAYSSVLGVDGAKPESIDSAIREVSGSYPDSNPANQVLVQPMVSEVAVSGVVFTRTLSMGAPYLVLNYDDETRSTESITSGSSREHKTLVILRSGSAADHVPDRFRGLVGAISEIEELLGFDSLDIEFAISSGGEVHIFQVRPIAVDHKQWEMGDSVVADHVARAQARFRSLQSGSPFVVGKRAVFGVMPDWNPAEIIGTKPGRLAMGLYRYLIMDNAWATQRAEYGYRDVRPQHLLVAFAGHPYVDIRASFNSFVPAGVPDELAARLVDFYVDWLEAHPHFHDKVEFEVVPTCLDLDFGRWERRLSSAGGFTKAEIQLLRDELRGITRRGIARGARDLASVQSIEKRFAAIMAQPMDPLEKAVILLEDCRSHGTVTFSHLARGAFVAVTLLHSAVRLGIISKEAMDSFLRTIRTVSHGLADDAAATRLGGMSWSDFVARYGHLRPGTYDISSLKYGDDPERYLRPIVERSGAASASHATQDEGRWVAERDAFKKAIAEAGLVEEGCDVEAFMRQVIEGREYSKFAFTRNLSAALDCIVAFGGELGLERGELAHAGLFDLFALKAGSAVTADPAAWLREQTRINRRERRLSAAVELPPILLHESDFVVFHYPNSHANFIGTGRVTARCIDLAEHDSDDVIDLAGAIVLIPQADPGYDWLFGQGIGGLITMYGGANSHMAIRAAEFGLPAAIGVGETQYARLARASSLELDAGNRNIRPID